MDFFFFIRKTTKANIRNEVAYTVHSYATKIEKKQSKILKVSWKKQQNPLLITVCVERCAIAVMNPVETVRLDL